MKRYLDLSRELLKFLDEEDFDGVEQLIKERELILGDLSGIQFREDERIGIAQEITALDKKIMESLERRKEELDVTIRQVKEEKRKYNEKQKAFRVYGEEKRLDKSIFFDKLK